MNISICARVCKPPLRNYSMLRSQGAFDLKSIFSVVCPIFQWTSVRSCSSIGEQELISFSLSKKKLEKKLGFSLSKKVKYSISLKECIIGKGPLQSLTAQIYKNRIQELSFSQSQIPQEEISSLLHACCLSDVTHLNLSGTFLRPQNLEALEDLLPQSQIRFLHLSLDTGTDKKSLEDLCSTLSIDLVTSYPRVHQNISIESNASHKSVFFLSKTLSTTIQGGFQSYQAIETTDDFLRIRPFLSEGFLITPTFARVGAQFVLSSLILTIARGKGFVVALNQRALGSPGEHLFQQIKKVIEDPSIPKVFNSYRKEFLWLKENGIYAKGLFFDLQFAKKFLSFKRINKILKKIKPIYVPKELKTEVVSSVLTRKRFRISKSLASFSYDLFLRIESELKRQGRYALFSKVLIPIEETLMYSRIQPIKVNQKVFNLFVEDTKAYLERSQENLRTYETFFLEKEERGFFEKVSSLFAMVLSRMGLGSNQEPLSFQEVLQNLKKDPDSTVLARSFYRAEEAHENQKKLSEKIIDSDLRIIYRTPDLFRGVSVIPKIYDLPDHLLAQLFASTPNRQIIRVQFRDLDLRVLSQISGDPGLVKICNNKKNDEDLEKAINKKLFKLKKFIHRTHEINAFVCGKLSKASLTNVLKNDAESSLGQYFQTFPKVRTSYDSLMKMEESSISPVYKKVRVLSNTFFSIFLTVLDKQINEEGLSACIFLADKYQLFLHVKTSETAKLQSLINKVSASVVRWSVSIPVFSEILNMKDESENPLEFINGAAQGVLSDIEHSFIRSSEIQDKKHIPTVLPENLKKELQEILDTRFSSIVLKPMQEEVINALLLKKTTVAILPTGYGKSICFQVPSLMNKGITIVISPLISLIENQIMDLSKKKISATWVRSKKDLEEVQRDPTTKIVYITPELFTSHSFLNDLLSVNVSLFVIDEAHCIYDWGNTFRDSYRKLGVIKELFPQTEILALSATLTTNTFDDLLSVLNIEAAEVVKGSFFRKNLGIRVERANDVKKQLKEFLEPRKNTPGIIYCQQQEEVNKLWQHLSKEGFTCEKYHAGMHSVERKASLNSFLGGKVNLMIATVAFGMGIDKPNIRFVCHTKMPGSLEQYYQEIGRAGRDGGLSECVLFFSDHDFMEGMILKKEIKDPAIRNEVHLKMNQMFFFSHNLECRQKQLSSYFSGKQLKETCGSCDVCKKTVESISSRQIIETVFQATVLTNGELGISSLSKFLCSEFSGSISLDLVNTALYGSLKQYPIREIRSLLRYLIQKGYLVTIESQSKTDESFLVLSAKGKDFLQNKEDLFIPQFSQILLS